MFILIVLSIGISFGSLLALVIFHDKNVLQLICTIFLMALSCCSLYLYQQNSYKDVALRSICFENLQPSSIDYKVESNDTIIKAYHYDIDSIHVEVKALK